MAALEKSDFDQCASCRDCALEAARTQATFDLYVFCPISRFTDRTDACTNVAWFDLAL